MPAAAVATYPLDKKGTFAHVQKSYTDDIRFGLYEDAIAYVEPSLQPRFREAMERFRELRFSDSRVESIEIDPLRVKATAVVRYRGYWLASPFEREVRIVQQWRREVPTQSWYVTPDFDALLGLAGS